MSGGTSSPKNFCIFSFSSFVQNPLLLTIFVKNMGKTGGTSILESCPDIWRISVVTELVTVDDVALHLSNIAHTTGIALKLKDSTKYTITRVECNFFTALFCWQRNTEKTVLASMLSHPQEFVEVAYTISSEKTTRKTKKAPEIAEEEDPGLPLGNRHDWMNRFF